VVHDIGPNAGGGFAQNRHVLPRLRQEFVYAESEMPDDQPELLLLMDGHELKVAHRNPHGRARVDQQRFAVAKLLGQPVSQAGAGRLGYVDEQLRADIGVNGRLLAADGQVQPLL
jgi:hypothetical protein